MDMTRIFVALITSVISLSSCDSQLVNKSLECTKILIVRINHFNPETRTGVILFEGEHMEHGMLRVRNHLSGLPPVTTTLKNGRYFHALPRDSDMIQKHVGENTIPVCWYEDSRFQNSRFYIRTLVNQN